MPQPEPENQTPTRADFIEATQRCAEAYHRVMADMPKNVCTATEQSHQYKAFLAFAAELPILCDLPSFQLYIACIAKGVAIGAIDPADAGRFCHIAQIAISAWKLANLVVPAAQAKERAAQQKQPTPLPPKGNHDGVQESQFRPSQPPQDPKQPPQDPKQPPQDPKQPTPLPPKGNHAGEEPLPYDDWQSLYAATKLPDWETQTELFKSLRDRGIAIPTDEELRGSPIDALRHCERARYLEQCAPPTDAPPAPQPPGPHRASDQQVQPAQAA
jgi:hypothetical protein